MATTINAKATETTLITITGRVPSKKNSLKRLQIGTRLLTVCSDAYLAWEREHHAQLIGHPALLPPYEFFFNLYAPDRRKSDLSNKFEGVADLLVLAGVIQDDNWFLLSDIHLHFKGVDRANPRVELTIVSAVSLPDR